MPATATVKVPKKIKTLSKRGGRGRGQEFAHDVPPRHRLLMTDVHRSIEEQDVQPGDDWSMFIQSIDDDWYDAMDRISYEACDSCV